MRYSIIHTPVAALLALSALACVPEAPMDPTRPAETRSNGGERSTRLYLTSFQSGRLYAIDTERERVVLAIEVEDGSGTIGVTPTSDGRRVLVVDGSSEHRVRVLDAATGKGLLQRSFQDRALYLGSGPVSALTHDDQHLFVETFDYSASPELARGVRLFDVEAAAFAPAGLRDTRCNKPALVSLDGGGIVEVCPNTLVEKRVDATMELVGTTEPLPTGIGEPTTLLHAPSSQEIFILDWIGAHADSWRLGRWRRGSKTVEVVDLWSRLDRSLDDPRGLGSSAAISPDGTTLAIVQNRRVWLLESRTLAPVRTLELSETADGAAFSRDGRELFTTIFKDQATVLVRIPTQSARPVREVVLQGVDLRQSPVQLLSVAAPLSD